MLLLGLIPLLLCLPSLGFGTATTTSSTPIKPWEISHLSTFSPSGRPDSSPWAVVNLTISDPNDTSVSPATCVRQWNFGNETPYDKVIACSEVPGGKWTFVMLEADGADGVTPSPITNFGVRFELEKKKKKKDGGEKWVGDAKFVVGENMSGLCAASGFCSFGLKEELAPFAVRQVQVR
ncbi:uncharacterized protein B0T15DRAFT_541257 [Chaetomium strumarium]|uniref:Uncharacterized protein n=1 Tax=Chaetomium strumarium TaxID=1170767 RepID=A0AAJ0GPP4_9PEZI|nr:hypothetical protein B0T15DRAFT_541257 [Chaetomium strumarium]